ncbi:hypothetical protein NDU88_003781 [Pleurodeles waltl]|uniref:Uncharacterized protein n=1 Tax=Pleurodeles waltl TaxID=8319 RepID=A0AAV7T781_PLEWA|nr:hypothetical protein NDU88_003781 [Pleurodeles waltl]
MGAGGTAAPHGGWAPRIDPRERVGVARASSFQRCSGSRVRLLARWRTKSVGNEVGRRAARIWVVRPDQW